MDLHDHGFSSEWRSVAWSWLLRTEEILNARIRKDGGNFPLPIGVQLVVSCPFIHNL